MGSSLRGQQLLSPLCVPCASPPSSLNLGAFWWGSPPVTVVPHLNSEIAHFLYGVWKKSTHHHQTVGLSCTQLTHSPATTHLGRGRVAHEVPGEYATSTATILHLLSITGRHRGPPTKEDHRGDQLQRGYQGVPHTYGPGRVRINFETQTRYNFFVFANLQGVTGAHPLKKTTIVISLQRGYQGVPPISRPGRVGTEVPGE